MSNSNNSAEKLNSGSDDFSEDSDIVKTGPSVLDIADVMLKTKLKNKDRFVKLSPMQLVKLAYISHGFHLALFRETLFYNRIEAWEHGPNIPDLYHVFKVFGSKHVPANFIRDDDFSDLSGDKSINRRILTVREVVGKYGHLTPVQLASLTNQDDSPYGESYEESQIDRYGVEIPDSVILKHYEKKVIVNHLNETNCNF